MQECFSECDVIKMAIQLEQNSKALYETAAQNSADPKLTEIFQFFSNDVNEHIDTFQKIYDQAQCGSETVNITKPEDLIYLETMMKSDIFQGEDKAINLVKTASNPLEVVTHALGFERDAMLFFVKIYRMVCEEDRKSISKLIKEKESHIKKLIELQKNLKPNHQLVPVIKERSKWQFFIRQLK